MKPFTKKQINRFNRFVTTILKEESTNEEPDVCGEAGKLLLEMEEYYERKLKKTKCPLDNKCFSKSIYLDIQI